MTVHANKDLAHRFVAAVDRGDIEAFDDLFVEDYVHHDPALPQEYQRSRDAYKRLHAMFRAALPDLRFVLEDDVAEGDRVVGRWTVQGTHRGDLLGIPPTGRSVTVTGIQILRTAGGRIAERWVNFDALGMLRQIGAVSDPGQPGGA
jgi:steroid delta-isomerase-like uncharacterized protein